MTPGKYPLKLYRGDTYTWTFRLWEDAAQTVPVDLTGATVAAQVRDKPGGATIVDLVTVATSPTPNTIRVSLTSDEWPGMPPGGAWDLEIVFPGGTVQTVVAGKVTVTPDVTNSTVAA